ncbi:MAG: rRNA maturation RNase YbeY [Anaerolineaceae bacterium]|jgi:probable rRNA maturation factor|nr:rRNA maturation RNase YbeY [Anaerolineaceae bacterium]
MINIIIAETCQNGFPENILEETAKIVLQHQNISPRSDLSIVIDTNEKLRELNQQFRNIDAPTDILSFPSGEIDPETGHVYLGDIIISWEKVQAQAIQQSVECEMRLMVVHGVLHLLGYDHATDSEQKEMWAVQNQILEPFGCTSPT